MIKNSTILNFILFSLILLPSTAISNAIRIEFFIVALLALLYLVREIKINRGDAGILLAFSMLPLFVGWALFLQFLTYGDTPSSYVFNFSGFLRPTIYAFVFAMILQRIENINKVISFLKVIIGINCSITIIEYCDILIIEDIINILYRGASNSDIGNRAIGLFYRVHGAAYFSLFSFIFIFSIYKINDIKIKQSDKALLSIIIIALMTTFSKGAILVLVIYMVGVNYFRQKLRKSVLIWTCVIILLMVISLTTFTNLEKHISALATGIFVLVTFQELDSSQALGFITGRLEHGWLNALSVWRESPIFGNINHGDFVGDGGYTEVMANHGLIGLAGYIIFFLILLFNRSFELNFIKNTTVICCMVAMLPVGLLMERTSEFLPLIFLIMRKLSDKKQKEILNEV